MSTQMPDTILQSAIYGRLLSAALSVCSAGVIFLDQAQTTLAAGLAIVAAAASALSKVREWLKVNGAGKRSA